MTTATATATLPTLSLPVIPPSSSVANSPFVFSLSNMFHCGCDPANVEEGVPMIYQQASYDSACAAAVDDEAFYYNHVVKHNNQIYQEQQHRSMTKDYFQHLPINSEMQGAIIIPTSPITSQHQREQQLQAISSNKSLEVTPVNSIEVTPVSSNRTIVTVTPDKALAAPAPPRFEQRNRIKHTVSNVTESTHSMSDDEMSIESSHEDEEEEENSKPTGRKPLVSILRQKPEDTSSRRIIQSPSRTHTDTRVQFAATTNLVNPAQRQHVPRLSLEARYAYAYQAGWLSATQEQTYLQYCAEAEQAVRNPKTSLTITTTTTNSAAVDVREGTCDPSSPHHADSVGGPERKRFQQRLERRRGQNQYLYRTHNTIGAAFESSSSPSPYMCKYGTPHPTNVSSSSSYATKKHCTQSSSSSYTAAEELLLSQLNYNDNSGFYVFR